MNNSGKPEAEIDEWVYDGVFLYGHITKHGNQGSFKRSYQQTSMVEEFNMLDGYAETENTYYRLGKVGEWGHICEVTMGEQLKQGGVN